MKKSRVLCGCASLLCSLPVYAVVTCDVTATGVAFGVYDPMSGANFDSSGTVAFTCTKSGSQDSTTNLGYTIRLSTGGSGTYSPRRLSSLGNTLNYQLYTMASRVAVWGNGTGGTSVVSNNFSWPSRSGGTRSRNHTVYGRIVGGQNVPTGNYTDAITVTVIF